MDKEYVQITYPTGTFAKTMTSDSKPGGLLEGWTLVCIHPHTYYHMGQVTEYIATFVREAFYPNLANQRIAELETSAGHWFARCREAEGLLQKVESQVAKSNEYSELWYDLHEHIHAFLSTPRPREPGPKAHTLGSGVGS